MTKRIVKQTTAVLLSLLLFVTLIYGIVVNFSSFGAGADIVNAFAEEETNDEDFKYLSDLEPYKNENFESGRPLIKDAIDANGTKMQVKIEGAWYTFDKGLFTHTASNKGFVSLYYNIENYNYEYFTAYVGLNRSATKGDGVGFNVGTSMDGTNWEYMVTSPQLIGPQAESQFICVELKGAKYLRLYASRGSNNAHDHAVWADAKLTNSLDDGSGIAAVEAYDAQIKAKGLNVDLNDPEFELLLLKREFVSRVGQYALKKFRSESPDNVALLDDWLFKDLDSLREFMLGGAPFKGNYYNSLTVLSRLYKSYKNDLKDKTLLNNKFMPDRTFGELCRTMMFSVALTHDGPIGSYLQASRPENQSEPLRRYAIFKYMYQTERFIATPKVETMTMFGSLRVEEMRYIMSNIIDDESIIWLNDYVQTRINATPGNAGNLHTPHPYVRYTDPNYNNPVFYAEENYDYFNTLFAVDGREVEGNAGKKIGMWDTKYIVPAGEGEAPYEMTISRSKEGEPKLQKVWMNFNNKFKTGSVCGGISKSGTNIRTARGIPAHVIGQPGHAAILYLSQDANGKGSWKIDNDVGGWLAATKGERHLLGWGNEAWQRNSSGTVVYFHLAQECLNDYDNLVKAEEYVWLAKVYQGNLKAQETLYEKALNTQIKNLDAWGGLVKTYLADASKTVADFNNLVARIADTLWNHPVPMHCLFRLFTDIDLKKGGTGIEEVDAVLGNPAFLMQIRAVETNALEKAKTSGSSAAKSKVNWLLGVTDTSVADFSFDGENAGSIVWSDTYSDGSFTWKYSLDGKKTWKEVTFYDGDKHVYALSEQELASVSTENDIYVYIVGASEANAYKIDVAAKPTLPDTLYANDWENRVIGVDGSYEWRYCERTETADGFEYKPTTGWICYADASPDCSGDKAIEVRLKGTSKKPASDGKIFTFTADKDTAERKYISVSYLSVVEFSTESKDAKRPNYAVNAIDGNAKTYWHTDYAISIKNPGNDENGNVKPYAPAYLTVKLDLPRWISALEFSQLQYNVSFSIFAKNVTVYVSQDGENWEVAGTRTNLENVEDLNAVHFDKPVYGQYVKLVMDSLHETNKNDGVFTTVSLINIYEDSTKTQSPDGEKMPSLSEVAPSGDKFGDLGGIISEEEASHFVPPSGSNAGGWIALGVVGGALVAGAAVVFVLYKRGIIKFKSKANAVAGGKPEKVVAESKAKETKSKASTAESKVKETKPKANTSEPKAKATKPETNTTESKVKETKPKADTAKSKSSAAKPKANTAESKVNATKPKANATKSKSDAAKPKNK
ncbi:MAG: NPCBM/NEW2 domain-containing protein [Clostridia bacterium]|nr:NPCBM/NEW2 domain-containing protein [Clostridia bacterium]